MQRIRWLRIKLYSRRNDDVKKKKKKKKEIDSLFRSYFFFVSIVAADLRLSVHVYRSLNRHFCIALDHRYIPNVHDCKIWLIRVVILFERKEEKRRRKTKVKSSPNDFFLKGGILLGWVAPKFRTAGILAGQISRKTRCKCPALYIIYRRYSLH